MRVRIIAFYLPQYHPIPENDLWWGEGFTEWTNVVKARPLFEGHYQPRIPTTLGYYDLRSAEVREAQAALAKSAGIEGFCYWHYWFGNGKRLLEKPFSEVLKSGRPDFPFCLAWANHSWSNKTWDRSLSKKLPSILMQQEYPGEQDNINHFYSVLSAFKDKRYITIDGKPVFIIFNPDDFSDVSNFISLWRGLAKQNGFNDIHFIGITSNTSFREIGRYKKGILRIPDLNDAAIRYNHTLNLGFDAVCSDGKTRAQISSKGLSQYLVSNLISRLVRNSNLNIYHQTDIIKHLYVQEDKWENVYPCVIPNWDRSPRNSNAEIYINSTPNVFKENLLSAIKLLENKSDEHKILFLKSWNEWGEGNYVEPDSQYGDGYLKVLKEVLSSNTENIDEA